MAVRVATAHDLGITARIAAHGFSLSPLNAFLRPHAKDYPEDMENSYRRQQEEALISGRKLFTVIESDINNAPDQSQDIVGFAIWNYAEESRRIHDDLHETAIGRLTSDEKKYFRGFMELDKMTLNPDHFRRGFGTKLCKYGVDMAMSDSVSVGLIARGSGLPSYEHLGFDLVDKQAVEDERPGKEANVDFWVMRWNYPSRL